MSFSVTGSRKFHWPSHRIPKFSISKTETLPSIGLWRIYSMTNADERKQLRQQLEHQYEILDANPTLRSPSR